MMISQGPAVELDDPKTGRADVSYTPANGRRDGQPDRSLWTDRLLVALFTITAATGAGLLFVVEPLVAKLLLPQYGGSATVWSTSSLFFQLLLIIGYLYVHVSTRRWGPSKQPWIHLAVLCVPLVALPLSLPDHAAPIGVEPVFWLLRTLGLMIGLPFLVLAATGPLLQRWFSWAGGPRSSDPYFLFAASNLGSFVGLLAYPLLIEPTLSLHRQRELWSIGYLIFLGLTATCGLVATVLEPGQTASPADRSFGGLSRRRVPYRQSLRWLGLAFLPSALMLAVTAHISTDVAPIPLLWVLPLAIYLLTFVVAFGGRGHARSPKLARVAVAVGFAASVTAMVVTPAPVAVSVMLNLILLFVVGCAAHGRLAAERPDPSQLTFYFVVISVGGAIGGVLNGLVAPLVFDRVLEYPLVLALVPLLLTGQTRAPGRLLGRFRPALTVPLVGAATVLVTVLSASVVTAAMSRSTFVFAVAVAAVGFVGLILSRRPALLAAAVAITFVVLTLGTSSHTIDQRRSFYGVYTVQSSGQTHTLIHGTTVHGTQSLSPLASQRPTTYYSRTGPFGDIWAVSGSRFDSVGVIGLGTGTIAAYGRPGQQLTFFEIDPEMVSIAADPDLFTYLRDSRAEVTTVVGDGRLEMAKEPSGTFDLIVLDAFSSDSIPVHLLTAEAMDLYADRLAPGGVLAVHISNRLFDLEPVVASGATRLGWSGAVVARPSAEPGATPSRWAVMSPDRDVVDRLVTTYGWRGLDQEHVVDWTDDYSSILSVLR